MLSMYVYFIVLLFLTFGHPTEPVASYCDYVSGSNTNSYQYETGNNQELCNSRMLRSLSVLNGNYAPAGIQFVLHPDYPDMLHATDPGYDGFYENATGGSSSGPSAKIIKAHYNIDNVLNIYIVDFVGTRDGTSGTSTYPWSLDMDIPGAFFKHGFLPGDIDARASAEYDRTLMHEIGHYFGLLHINGIWYIDTDTLKKREVVYDDDCLKNGDFICDTPAEPGMSNGAWYTNSNNRECIYHGYGGSYNSIDSTLKIGGYNKYFLYGEGDPTWEAYYPKYNYCEAWGIEDPYGLDHCKLFTNYDNVGDFFGTRDLNSEICLNYDQSEYATECHINNYSYLPIGHNFMRAGSSPYYSCGVSPINDNNYYNESKSGFTEEQYSNIRYFAEHCYTGCWDIGACNFDTTSTHLLRIGLESCEYEYVPEDDCISDCLIPSNQISRNKNVAPSTLSYMNSLPDNNLDCATDELYGDFTEEVLTNLTKTRKKVRKLMKKNLNRNKMNTLTIPVVFHNLYKLESLSSNTPLLPQYFEIERIYPNPFNAITTIHYNLSKNTDIQILIHDITGKVIGTLINKFQTAGYHSIKWDASNFSSGIYFLNISSGEISDTKKLIIIK